MSKNLWWPAEGVIVDVENAFGHHDQKYTIEVRKPDGPLIRRVVKHKALPPYDVGTRVKVQISDVNEIRFDPSAPGEAAIISTMDMSSQIAEAAAAFGRATEPMMTGPVAAQPDGGPAPPGGETSPVKSRLAVLGELLSEGVLTQSEYEAQRLRIISEI